MKAGHQQLRPRYIIHAIELFWVAGDQYDVSRVIKPIDQDRNVNIEELLFARNYAGGCAANSVSAAA